MVQGFILIAWERSVSVWGKLLNVFSSFLPFPSDIQTLMQGGASAFSCGIMFNVSHGIKQCLGGILLPYNIWKPRCCKNLQESSHLGK